VQRGQTLKKLIKFHPAELSVDATATRTSKSSDPSQMEVVELSQFDYYYDKESYFANRTSLPLPENVIPRLLQDKIGLSALADVALGRWFTTLPIHVWINSVANFSLPKPRIFKADGK
jgi:hypothetical protein